MSVTKIDSTLESRGTGKAISGLNDTGGALTQGDVLVFAELLGVVSELEVAAGEIATVELGCQLQVFRGPVDSETFTVGERLGLDASGNIVADDDAGVQAGTTKLIALPRVDIVGNTVGGLNAADGACKSTDTWMEVGVIVD